jgi:hypothetical protein
MVFALIVVALTAGCPQKDSNQGVNDAIRKALSIPVDENTQTGAFLPPIGTLYCPEVLNPKSDKNPDTCLYSDPTSWFKNPADASTTESKIFLQRSIDSFQTNKTIAKSVNVTADLPLIGQIVSANAGVDVGRNTTVKISGGSASKEVIAWMPFREAVKSNTFTQDTTDLLLSRKYAIVLIDYVVNDMNAKITVDNKLNVNAKASLTKAIVGLGKNTSAGVTVTNNNDGTFTVTAKRVIVASVIGPPDASVAEAAGPLTTEAAKGQEVIDLQMLKVPVKNELKKSGQGQ